MITGTFAAASVLCVCAATYAASPTPFDSASLVPPDVSVFLHVSDAKSWRQELADRPIARWINSTLMDGDFGKAWSSLASSVGAQPGPLFDQCLGKSFTLVIRPAANNVGKEQTEWALLTSIPQDVSTRLLKDARARVREPRFGLAVSELPEQAMLVAREDHRMIVGPADRSGLFDEVVERLSTDRLVSLAQEPQIKQAATLGRGSAGVMIRHQPPMGGWSVAVAELGGERVQLRHAAHFDASPLMQGVTKLTCDFSPVLAFEGNSLLAIGQPMDVTNGSFETFISASVGEQLINPRTREGLGDRRLTVFMEPPIGQVSGPSRLPGVSVANCLELKSDGGAIAQLERQLERASGHSTRLADGAFLTQDPCAAVAKAKLPRETAPAPAATWFAGGFPIMEKLTLSWTVADGPDGSWFIIAGHPRTMDSVAQVLREPGERRPCFAGRLDSCGVGNGVRISRQLMDLAASAERIAEPGRCDELRQSLGAMSELAAGLQRCRWQLARPSANEVRLDVQITLTPPESSRTE